MIAMFYVFTSLAISSVIVCSLDQNKNVIISEKSFNSRVTRQATVNWEQAFAIVGPDAIPYLISSTLATQFFIAAGWIISGFIFNVMTENSFDTNAISFVFGPQSVATNLFRCLVSFTFVFFGLFVKTVLTVGMGSAMRTMMDTKFDAIFDRLTSEAFLRNRISRGIFAAVFQLIGWSLLGIVFEKNNE